MHSPISDENLAKISAIGVWHKGTIEQVQARIRADANIIDGLQRSVCDLRNKLEEAENALGRRRDGTHWDDCWKSHLACALVRIERMQQEIDLLRNPGIVGLA